MSFMDFFKDNFGGLLQGGIGSYAYADQMKRMGQTEDDVSQMFSDVRGDVGDAGTFQAYGMTSGLGSSGFDAQGNQTFGLNQPQQAYSDQMRTGAMDAYGRAMGPNEFAGQAQGNFARGSRNAFNPGAQRMFGLAEGDNQMQNMGMEMTQRSMQDQAGRENDIYGRIRAMQRPEEGRQQEQMTSNLFGSGRGGMGSGAFGASPEEHGFNMARNEAMNNAAYQSMGQALQEQTAQSQMGQSMYGQGMQERQMYENMGAQRYGIGQQDMQMFNQLGLQQYGLGQQNQQMYGQLGGQMGQAQYDPYQQLLQQNAAAQQGGQMANQSGQAMAGLLAQLGIGESTAAVNFGNNQASMFAALADALGLAASGVDTSAL